MLRLHLVSLRRTLFAFVLLAIASVSAIASAGVYSFGRTDYLLQSYLNGLDSVAVADLDGDQQNDLVIGGNDLSTSGGGNIADYVPGFPIAPGAAPTHSFASIPYLYDLVTADFDVDGKLDIAAIGDDDFDDDDATIAIHRATATVRSPPTSASPPGDTLRWAAGSRSSQSVISTATAAPTS